MKRLGKALTIGVTLSLLALPFIVWWKAQAITDWWALRDYTPSARIAALAAGSSMTPTATHIFYVNHPTLIGDANTFHEKCPQSEQTIVLGCYHSNQKGIIIRDISDPRLSGIHEVTAAHEMLHAAYDRLSSDEKADLDYQLKNYFDNELKNERILETINTYENLEPDELINEMHSIFGTEARSLPPTLEVYYKKYFNNREEVLELAENYETEFTSRINAYEDYERRLDSLKAQIDAATEELEKQREQIISDRRRLDSLRSSGRIEEYNSGVAAFNERVDAYNSAVRRIQRDISTFNKLLEEQKTIAKELRSLNQSIDSRNVPELVQ